MSAATDYGKWIAVNVREPAGKCREWSAAMATAFPELRLARGWFHELGERAQGHWWCVAPGGAIVDPTRDQFRGPGEYEEVTDPDLLPTGHCLNCGGPTFHGLQVCCDTCGDELAESYRVKVQ